MAKFILALLAYSLLAASKALPQKYPLIPKTSFLSPRIVGGGDAVEGEFPHQISIRVYDGSQHICGGSLIQLNGIQLVITAAHCVIMEGYDYTLVAGSLKLSDCNQTEYFQSRPVTRVIVHEDYHRSAPTNDIALLLIDRPFQLNPYVQPIPLPKMMQETTGDAIVSGWGRISYGGPLPDTLQKLQVRIVDENACKKVFGDVITPRMICAGLLDDDGDKSPCHGDSGGPLEAVENGYLAGIVSWGRTVVRQDFLGFTPKHLTSLSGSKKNFFWYQ